MSGCTGPGGVWVFAPDGRLLGKVSIPEPPANLHWGGADWRTLYVCASTSVYAVPVKVGPRNEPFMRARPAATATPATDTEPLRLDAARCALIIQDMQNDVVMDGGAFAASGSPDHCRQQNAIPNIARLAARCRALGVPVIHVWFLRRADARDMTLNAPLFEGCVDANAMIEGSWGAEPVPGLEAQPGDHVVRKARMSAWEGTSLERILKAEGRSIIIETGAWTNMSIEHTARTGADKGYVMVIPEDGCSTMNADWHRASIDYAMQNVAAVTTSDEVLKAISGNGSGGDYEDSLTTAKTLQMAIGDLLDAPTDATLAAARTAWIAARVPYQQTEGLRFGNALVDEWEGKVNAWPLDEGLIDYVDAGSYGDRVRREPALRR
jgi:gluconolactonase